MLVGIHQPEYLPWPGFFNKIIKSNTYVILDTVQFTIGGFNNRNRIATIQDSKWLWLTVPIRGSKLIPINEIRIDNSQNWASKHWKSMQSSYCRTPYFKEIGYFFKDIYNNKQFEKLIDLNFAINNFIIDFLDIKAKLVTASEIKPAGKKTDLLIDICKKVGGDIYLSGIGGKNYLEEEKFKKEGLLLEYQKFHIPKYPQLLSGQNCRLSIIDMISNVGKTKTKKLISQIND